MHAHRAPPSRGAIDRAANDLIGLSLAEAKSLAAGVQETMIEVQAREALARESACVHCGQALRRNGSHSVQYRTLFGRLRLASPRLYACPCQGQTHRSHSPISAWLGSHTSLTTWKRHAAKVGERLDRQAHEHLPTSRAVNASGLPRRHPLKAVGIDGAYVKAADAPS
jgi:hypothetical protein